MNLSEERKRLNAEQLEAVQAIDGPLLVVAGPGTGKTQILALRVAEILEQTDTAPSSILCLTYTNAGAENMRERLHRFLGAASYDVSVHTYHAFGEVILREYADYFTDRTLATMVDDLKRHEILTGIINELPYNDPLRFNTDAGQIGSVISDMKKGDLTAKTLGETAAKNLFVIAQVGVIEFPESKKYEELAPGYEKIYEEWKGLGSDYLRAPLIALREALDNPPTTATGKTSITGLTGWRKKWCKKDNNDKWVLGGEFANSRAASLAIVFERYAEALCAEGLYDYDDMILEAIRAIETNDDLRFTLQERWQYVLLDEYQDTNKAQDRIVELLTNNPASEGRPNVMAVGDDDQTVYGFQGALASRLGEFAVRYRDTKLVVLNTNYRSGGEVVELSQKVIAHVPAEDRIAVKEMEAFSGAAEIRKMEYGTEGQEFSALAKLAKKEWEAGRNVAVIAPKHKVLIEAAEYLAAAEVPTVYEKRENVFDVPAVRKIINILRLVVGISDGRNVAHLYPRALSAPWLGLRVVDLMEKNYGEAGEWIDELAVHVDDEPLDTFLVRVIDGRFKDYYLGEERKGAELYQITSGLNTLRRNVQNYFGRLVRARDLVQYVDGCEAAGVRVSAGAGASEVNAVSLLTAHSAKGLEFDTVIVANADDATWGVKKGNNNRLSLPWNFEPVFHTGDSHGEAARVFFVAVSRAKSRLYLLSKAGEMPLRFLPEMEVEQKEAEVLEKAEMLELPWLARALAEPGLEVVLRDKLKNLRLSPTDLTSFLDVQYGGPEAWFERKLLNFPTEDSAQAQYGNLVHEIMRVRPDDAIGFADTWIAGKKFLPKDEKYLRERVRDQLPGWLAERLPSLSGEALVEKWFDGHVGEVPVGGKLDRLEIDAKNRRLTIVDFKTGKPRAKWDRKDTGLRSYQWQLAIYKLLVGARREYAGWEVLARIEFVTPEAEGMVAVLPVELDEAILERAAQLLAGMWKSVQKLDFPDVSGYTKSVVGMEKFEEYLIAQ